MKWFRSNVKHGTRLALFALAVQFALSFGHFHAIAAPAAIQSAAQSGISYTGIFTAPGAVSKSSQQRPASDHDSDKSDDVCAICAVVVMANAALFATPPVLLSPQAVEFQYLTTEAGFVHLNSARVAFQPRAPPAS